MLLLNNNLNMYFHPDVTVKRVNRTLGIYSLKNLERENVLVALCTNTTTALLFTLQKKANNVLEYVAETKTCLYA